MNYFDLNNQSSSIIIVNGVKMTMAEFNKMKRAKANNTKRKKKELNEIQLLPSDINALMKNVKVFKSLEAFYNNGYRQWGTIHRQLLNIDNMGAKFALMIYSIGEINSLITKICRIAKKKDKSVYAYVQKLSYKMVDAKLRLKDLYKVVMGSGVLSSPFNNHEMVNGSQKRLGLKILTKRSSDAINELDNIIKRLNEMSVIPDSVYNNERITSYGAN